MELLLCVLYQSVVIPQVSIFFIYALCIDIISGLRKVADIFVTEIGVCDRVLLLLNDAPYNR